MKTLLIVKAALNMYVAKEPHHLVFQQTDDTKGWHFLFLSSEFFWEGVMNEVHTILVEQYVFFEIVWGEWRGDVKNSLENVAWLETLHIIF